MLLKKKKSENKEYLRNVAVYRYHTDTGRLEIFPNCILYEQTGIVPRQIFARGITKTIDDSNMILVDSKQGGDYISMFCQYDYVLVAKSR